jgi:hypothetical protein
LGQRQSHAGTAADNEQVLYRESAGFHHDTSLSEACVGEKREIPMLGSQIPILVPIRRAEREVLAEGPRFVDRPGH